MKKEEPITDQIEIFLIIALIFLSISLFLWALISSLIIIQEYELGMYMRLGRYVKTLKPGVHVVIPYISRVYRVDTRMQTLEVNRMEIMTKDLSPTILEAIVQFRLKEPEKSLLTVEKYKSTLNHIAQSHIRNITINRTLEELIRGQNGINREFKTGMIKEGTELGMEIIRAEFKEIEPVGPVKAAIEDRIAAEKERQAMILRADGRKQALIMEASARDPR